MAKKGDCSITLVAAALLVSATLFAPCAFAATFIVNSVLDQPDDLTSIGTCHTAAGTCTLRAAVMQANRASAATATIVLPAGTYALTIPIAGADGETNGDLNLTAPAGAANAVISIEGAGAASTIIDGQGNARIFHVHANRIATISDVSMQNGFVAGPSPNGGGIYNEGSLTVSNSKISGNHAERFGGGFHNLLNLSVLNSTVTLNTSGTATSAGEGGAIYNQGDLNVRDSTIGPANTAASYGGGIYIGPSHGLTMRNSTIHGNRAPYGGGIANYGGMTAMNSTISQNKADFSGGGIASLVGTTNVYNSTIAFNTADANGDGAGVGGGVYNLDSNGAVYNQRNTLLVGNSTGTTFALNDDCAGTLTGFGDNRYGVALVASGCHLNGVWSTLNSISLLGPLQDNGGPTRTHALLLGNNAIDSGLVCVDYASNPLPTDQRGAPRIFRSSCDIGAVEYLDRGLDIDNNHAYDPLSDGLLILRYLFGLTSTQLTAGAIGTGSTIAPENILVYLNYFRPLLDVDGNGQMDALTDGLMLVRYLSGLRGAALISNTLGATATRSTATQIEWYIKILTP